jgi:hypothetical protein
LWRQAYGKGAFQKIVDKIELQGNWPCWTECIWACRMVTLNKNTYPNAFIHTKGVTLAERIVALLQHSGFLLWRWRNWGKKSNARDRDPRRYLTFTTTSLSNSSIDFAWTATDTSFIQDQHCCICITIDGLIFWYQIYWTIEGNSITNYYDIWSHCQNIGL